MFRPDEFAAKELVQYLANDPKHPSATAIAAQCPIMINMLARVVQHWKTESWNFAHDFLRTGPLLCEQLLAQLRMSTDSKLNGGPPLWVKVFGAIALILVSIVAAVHLAGSGVGQRST